MENLVFPINYNYKLIFKKKLLLTKIFCPHRFVIANDVFKFKEFNLESKQCRRTSLAPRFGNPPTTLLVIPPPPGPISETAGAENNAPAAQSANAEYKQRGGEGRGGDMDDDADLGGEERGEDDGEEKAEQTEVAPPALPQPEYFAFATNNRVIGLSSFPLTGDPSQVRHTHKKQIWLE